MMNPKTDPNDMNASSAACRVDSTKKKTRSRFVLGCLLVVSLILVMLCIPIYFMLRGESYWAWRADRVTVLLHEVIEPLEKKYEFQNDIGSFHNWTVSFRLEVKNPDQLTEIVKEVYTLKQNSPGLSREVFDVEFVSSDPQNPVTQYEAGMNVQIAYPPESTPK